MSNVGELPHSELTQVPDDVRDVVEELVKQMPNESWRLVGYDGPTHGHALAKFLKSDSEVVKQFFPGNPRGRKLRVVAPNTLVIGLNDRKGTWPPVRLGLFSLMVDERYNPRDAIQLLQGQFPSYATHEGINPYNFTGRQRGEVSLILPRQHLRGFDVIDISHEIQRTLHQPDSIVSYTVGNNVLFCARGVDFLRSYGSLAEKMGIPINLPKTGNSG